MNREILQQALDALDNLGSMSDHDVTPYAWHGAKAEAACAALREALSAPEPEPVAYVPRCRKDGERCIEGEYRWDEIEEKPFKLGDPEHWECAFLYASPPPGAEQPEGDVVVSWDEQGQIVAVTRQDEEGRILSVIAEITGG